MDDGENETGDHGGYADRVRMHADDLEAQRAWVAAKRMYEQARGAAPVEHPAGFAYGRVCRPVSSW